MEVIFKPTELMNQIAIDMIKKSAEVDKNLVLPLFADVDKNIKELVAIFLQKGVSLDVKA